MKQLNKYNLLKTIAPTIAATWISVSCHGLLDPITTLESPISANPSPTPTSLQPLMDTIIQSRPSIPTKEQNPLKDINRNLTNAAKMIDRGSGEESPDFQIVLLDGQTIRLSDFRGKVVVLNFWASWCGPCIKEMPDFEKISQEYKSQGVVFLGIAVSDIEENSRSFAKMLGITYSLGSDPTGNITRDYHVTNLPTTFLINQDGNQTHKFGIANKGALKIFLRGQLEGQ